MANPKIGIEILSASGPGILHATTGVIARHQGNITSVEIIHDGEGDHQVSWRVDRIRDSEVVLVRVDATHSIVPSSTKVLALRHAPAIADDDELED